MAQVACDVTTERPTSVVIADLVCCRWSGGDDAYRCAVFNLVFKVTNAIISSFLSYITSFFGSIASKNEKGLQNSFISMGT